MGMPGMTNADASAYATSAKQEEKLAELPAKLVKSPTVAEFRNGFNHITKYYDDWSADDFLRSSSISMKTKIEVMFGKYIASFVDEDTLMKINTELKGE